MSDSNTPSLADRIGTKPLDAGSASFTPASGPSSSWADEVASPTTKVTENPLEKAQTDGATDVSNGSGLHDAQYEVEVKLSDLQGDTTSPLYSIHSFEELGMYAILRLLSDSCAHNLQLSPDPERHLRTQLQKAKQDSRESLGKYSPPELLDSQIII